MKTFLSLIFILSSVIAFSQSFDETIITGNFPDPYTEKVADIDDNTFEDIVACGLGGITWFKNLDGTNFETISIFDSVWVRDIDLVDFDGDTDMDIVGFNGSSGILFWLNNDGSENFTYTFITDTLPDIKYITVVDCDNDGDVDIFFNVYNGGFYDIYLYENNAGAFTATKIDRVDFSKDIYVFDYQNDGDYDFITKANYFPFDTEEIGIMINDGANVFTELIIYESTGDVDINDVHFVDIDNSGIGDLVIADNVQNELFWLQDAGWTRHNIRTSVDVSTVLVQDYDFDGVKDVSYKDENTSNYSFYALRGNNPGPTMSFTDMYSFELEVSSNDLEAFDANQDNYPEFAYSTAYKDEVGYFHNGGGFIFTNVKLSSYIPIPDCLRRVDLDLDGDLDILAFATDETLSWFELLNDGTYEQHTVISALDNPSQFEVHDMNGDGYPDIITASTDDDDFSIWYNDGSQVFTEQLVTWSNTQLDNPSYFSIADLDNDGDDDFAIVASAASTRPKGIFWIRNEGAGTFSSPIAIQSGLNYMGEVVTYDFDGDGNIDIVVADGPFGSAGLRLIKNNGGGSFTTSSPLSFKAETIKLGDIDSDGLMDFVVRNDDDNDIVWMKNDGGFTFADSTIVMSEARDVEFSICDEGNDGVTDIFFYTNYFGFTNTTNFTVGLLTNDGSENFTLTYYLTTQTNMNSGMAMDLEMDGDVDFILAYDYADKISIFENLDVDLLDPVIITWPTASDINAGESLASSVLSGGSASVPGIFSFTNPAITPPVGYYTAEVIFTPADPVTYNSVLGSAQVLVTDTIPPVAVCQDITVYLDGAGLASITAADIDGGSTDNVGIASLVASQTSFNCSDIGVNSVTLVVTDNFSNVDSCTAIVTIADTVSPTAVCQNITVYLDGAGSATVYAADIDGGSSDNCGLDTIFMIDGGLPVDQIVFSCSDLGPNAIQLVALDASMNFGTCVAVITVLDTISPTAVCQNITVYLDGSGNATITAADIDGGSTDNCGIPSLGASQTTFTCSDIGPNTVNLTATDGSTNSSNCNATVTVVDTVSPAITCPGNQTAYANASCQATIPNFTGMAVVSDNCDASPAVTQSPLPGTIVSGAGTTVNVTLTATDASSNSTDCNFIVTIQDSIKPTISCPGNQTVYVGASCQATVPNFTGMAVASDNCDPSPVVSQIPAPGTIVSTTTTITLTATDASTNSSNCTFDIILSDTTSPVAVCQNITVYLDGSGNATITAANIDGGCADNCGVPSLSASQTTFTCADLGPNTVTLTATDGSTNSSDCDAIVTVMDTISPVVTCIGDTTICDDVLPDYTGLVIASDNCGIMNISQNPIPTSVIAGPTLITITATDSSSNSSYCTFTVTPNASSSSTDSIVACFSYTWIDGNTYAQDNDTATWTIPNAAGCDSVITLNLTINTVDTSVTVADPMITANVTGALYQWLDCNSSYAIISGETGQSFTAITNGSYAVEITENGCTDTSACVQIVSTGIGESGFENIVIYPNPNSGQFSIDFGGLDNPILRIYTIAGKLLMERRNITEAVLTVEFNEAAGIYVLEIISEGYSRKYKLIKE